MSLSLVPGVKLVLSSVLRSPFLSAIARDHSEATNQVAKPARTFGRRSRRLSQTTPQLKIAPVAAATVDNCSGMLVCGKPSFSTFGVAKTWLTSAQKSPQQNLVVVLRSSAVLQSLQSL